MKRSVVKVVVACSVLSIMAAASSPTSAVVSQITLGDFNDPVVLDFQSVPLGAIAGNDPIFTNIGIAQIIPTPQGTDTDGYDNRTNSSRALAANSTGLFVADPGTAGAADTNDWQIDFSKNITRFGFATHDQNTLALATLYFDGVQVGSLDVTPSGNDLFQVYVESTVPFNSFQISQPGTASGFGFVLDNLTLEKMDMGVIPEPITAMLGLMGLGVLGMATRRRVA